MVGVNSWFQEPTKMKIACVAIAGIIRGIAIVLNVRNSPLPSIRAASTISSGRPPSINCLMKNTTEGEAAAGRINGQKVLIRPILYISLKKPMMETCVGIISTTMMKVKAILRSLNRYTTRP